MTDRLQIEITGDLPDAGKFAVLASAENRAKLLVVGFAEEYSDLKLTVSVKAIRPGKKATANGQSTATALGQPGTGVSGKHA